MSVLNYLLLTIFSVLLAHHTVHGIIDPPAGFRYMGSWERLGSDGATLKTEYLLSTQAVQYGNQFGNCTNNNVGKPLLVETPEEDSVIEHLMLGNNVTGVWTAGNYWGPLAVWTWSLPTIKEIIYFNWLPEEPTSLNGYFGIYISQLPNYGWAMSHKKSLKLYICERDV